MQQTLFSVCASGALFAFAGVSLAADMPATFTKDIAPDFSGKVPGVPSARIHGADVAGDL